MVQGEWIHEERETIWGTMTEVRVCSVCGAFAYHNAKFQYDFPYCPNCGAEMKGEDNDEKGNQG